MVWVLLLTEALGVIRERLSLANKRAELATTPEEKRKAIDEGLVVTDTLHRMVDKIRGLIPQLGDNPASPVVPK